MDVVSVYNELLKKYGHQGWWPILIIEHESRNTTHKKKDTISLTYGITYAKLNDYKKVFRDPYFEIAVGALLTQNTAWRNVTVAIQNLYDAKALTPERLLKLSTPRLEKLIRPAGYFRQKEKKLRLFAKWLIEKYDGDIERLKYCSLITARCSLLDLWGIGKETADSILLYALNKPIFVIDEYTRRFCRQEGVEFKEYDEYQKFFEEQLIKAFPRALERTKIYQEFHGLIVAWGKL